MKHPKSDQELDEILNLAGDMPVLLKFSADWCPPCQRIKAPMEEMALEYNDKIEFIHVDTEECRLFQEKYDVKVMPTIKMQVNGITQPEDEVKGANMPAIKALVEKYYSKIEKGKKEAPLGIKYPQNDGEFDKILREAGNVPVMVNFSSKHVKLCLKIREPIELMAQKYGDQLIFVHVDTDVCQQSYEKFNIEAMPTSQIFVNEQAQPGEIVEGAKVDDIEEMVKDRHTKTIAQNRVKQLIQEQKNGVRLQDADNQNAPNQEQTQKCPKCGKDIALQSMNLHMRMCRGQPEPSSPKAPAQQVPLLHNPQSDVVMHEEKMVQNQNPNPPPPIGSEKGKIQCPRCNQPVQTISFSTHMKYCLRVEDRKKPPKPAQSERPPINPKPLVPENPQKNAYQNPYQNINLNDDENKNKKPELPQKAVRPSSAAPRSNLNAEAEQRRQARIRNHSASRFDQPNQQPQQNVEEEKKEELKEEVKQDQDAEGFTKKHWEEYDNYFAEQMREGKDLDQIPAIEAYFKEKKEAQRQYLRACGPQIQAPVQQEEQPAQENNQQMRFQPPHLQEELPIMERQHRLDSWKIPNLLQRASEVEQPRQPQFDQIQIEEYQNFIGLLKENGVPEEQIPKIEEYFKNEQVAQEPRPEPNQIQQQPNNNVQIPEEVQNNINFGRQVIQQVVPILDQEHYAIDAANQIQRSAFEMQREFGRVPDAGQPAIPDAHQNLQNDENGGENEVDFNQQIERERRVSTNLSPQQLEEYKNFVDLCVAEGNDHNAIPSIWQYFGKQEYDQQPNDQEQQAPVQQQRQQEQEINEVHQPQREPQVQVPRVVEPEFRIDEPQNPPAQQIGAPLTIAQQMEARRRRLEQNQPQNIRDDQNLNNYDSDVEIVDEQPNVQPFDRPNVMPQQYVEDYNMDADFELINCPRCGEQIVKQFEQEHLQTCQVNQQNQANQANQPNQAHQANEEEVEVIQCDICNERIAGIPAYIQHIEAHHREMEQPQQNNQDEQAAAMQEIQRMEERQQLEERKEELQEQLVELQRREREEVIRQRARQREAERVQRRVQEVEQNRRPQNHLQIPDGEQRNEQYNVRINGQNFSGNSIAEVRDRMQNGGLNEDQINRMLMMMGRNNAPRAQNNGQALRMMRVQQNVGPRVPRPNSARQVNNRPSQNLPPQARELDNMMNDYHQRHQDMLNQFHHPRYANPNANVPVEQLWPGNNPGQAIQQMLHQRMNNPQRRAGSANSARARGGNDIYSQLPRIKFKEPKPEEKEHMTQDKLECTICLAEYKEGDNIVILPCFHQFHDEGCMAQSYKARKQCPICRSEIKQE